MYRSHVLLQQVLEVVSTSQRHIFYFSI
ncbi:unnamed protein product [Acanthoscelides obtectus]|uniref:Uncharacterized protein n=1 Tax=Acanthoscelides obtectus TaxID=200917 RepID=A0A9P0KI02_ACAOB|nr:unnamed protein product [Acanthoscelides obtectus]CAK1624818.1 hypothetical protein AOBTE_LOCUS2780 [Acanthoscelides obtectus]